MKKRLSLTALYFLFAAVLILTACLKKETLPSQQKQTTAPGPGTEGFGTGICGFTQASHEAFYHTGYYDYSYQPLYGPMQGIDSVVYNAAGLPVSARLGFAGIKLFFSYDAQNKLTMVKRLWSSGSIDFLVYHDSGNQTFVTRSTTQGTEYYTISYDAQGRIVQLDYNTPNTGAVYYKWAYYADGNLKAITSKKTPTGSEVNRYTFRSYDNQRNPFSLYPWNLVLTNYSVNNPVFFTSYNFSTDEVHCYSTYSYNYNRYGYPIGAVRKDSFLYMGKFQTELRPFSIRYECN